MFRKCLQRVRLFFDALNLAIKQFKTQSSYEILHVSTCPKTGRHFLEIKITGKSQSITYSAEEIVVDNSFILGFPPGDICTITYLATCDRYEKILQEEKISKCYELIRARSRTGEKTIHLRHKHNGEHLLIALNSFADSNIIDQLVSQDAYHLGYLAGQEQSLKDSIRLKLIARSQQDAINE